MLFYNVDKGVFPYSQTKIILIYRLYKCVTYYCPYIMFSGYLFKQSLNQREKKTILKAKYSYIYIYIYLFIVLHVVKIAQQDRNTYTTYLFLDLIGFHNYAE